MARANLHYCPIAACGWLLGCLLSSTSVFAGAITIATGLDYPAAVKVDANGANLIFSQTSQAQSCGGGADQVDAIPADENSGEPEPIATGTAIYDSGRCRGVSEIALSQGFLVYGYGGYVTTDIDEAQERSPCLSSCAHLEQNLGGAGFLGNFDGCAIYFQNFADIDNVAINGGRCQGQLTSSHWPRSNVIDDPDPNYASSSSGLYFFDYDSFNVERMDLNGYTVSPIIQNISQEGYILTDSQNVYFSAGQNLYEGAKSSSCSLSTADCLSLYTGTLQSYAVDESENDTADQSGSAFVSDGTNLWQTPKNGSAATKIYSGTNIQTVSTDGSDVYFVDNGALEVLPVNAANHPVDPLMLVSSSVNVSYSELGDGFYWADDGDGTDGAGSLYYVVEQASQLDSLQYTKLALVEKPNKMYKCSCEAAVFAMLARNVLRAQGQYVAASGIKIDDFFYIATENNPCNPNDNGGAYWYGNNNGWMNPVSNNITFGTYTKVTKKTNIASLLSAGPVLLQTKPKSAEPHWILATNVATVQYGSNQVTGVVAYDPLSGTKLLLQESGGTYQNLILDPLTDVWSSCSGSCTTLLSDINGGALQFSYLNRKRESFSLYDLDYVLGFTPNYYCTTSVTPSRAERYAPVRVGRVNGSAAQILRRAAPLASSPNGTCPGT